MKSRLRRRRVRWLTCEPRLTRAGGGRQRLNQGKRTTRRRPNPEQSMHVIFEGKTSFRATTRAQRAVQHDDKSAGGWRGAAEYRPRLRRALRLPVMQRTGSAGRRMRGDATLPDLPDVDLNQKLARSAGICTARRSDVRTPSTVRRMRRLLPRIILVSDLELASLLAVLYLAYCWSKYGPK